MNHLGAFSPKNVACVVEIQLKSKRVLPSRKAGSRRLKPVQYGNMCNYSYDVHMILLSWTIGFCSLYVCGIYSIWILFRIILLFCQQLLESYHSTSLLNRQPYNLAGDGPKFHKGYTIYDCWNIQKPNIQHSGDLRDSNAIGLPLNVLHWNSQGYNSEKT